MIWLSIASFRKCLQKTLSIPGPDLACQYAVIESEAFISSENSCISTFRRASAGLLILSK
jgi:hypothetical protein